MKIHYTVEPLDFKILEVLPKSWEDNDYKQLLEAMDYGDTTSLSSTELKEMCMLSIADEEPEEAARILLQYVFKDRLNRGQIDNISHEMTTEKIWEEYAELSMHEDFFNVAQLLYKSYNGKFPHPEAVYYEVQISSKEPEGISLFKEDPEATLLRILMKGMPDNTLLNRLFSDKLEGEAFKDAQDIIWQFRKKNEEEKRITFEIISSSYWLHDLKFTQAFEATLDLEEQL